MAWDGSGYVSDQIGDRGQVRWSVLTAVVCTDCIGVRVGENGRSVGGSA